MEPAKHIIKRFVEELWNARRLDIADQIFSEDCVTHQLRSGVLAEPAHRGPQAMKEHLSGWLMSFPDLRFNIEQMIAERDHVVSHLVMEGTHQGTWMGISLTGKRLQIRLIAIHRIANSKIAEDWVFTPDGPRLSRGAACVMYSWMQVMGAFYLPFPAVPVEAGTSVTRR
jgi:predicted ester cyclase